MYLLCGFLFACLLFMLLWLLLWLWLLPWLLLWSVFALLSFSVSLFFLFSLFRFSLCLSLLLFFLSPFFIFFLSCLSFFLTIIIDTFHLTRKQNRRQIIYNIYTCMKNGHLQGKVVGEKKGITSSFASSIATSSCLSLMWVAFS